MPRARRSRPGATRATSSWLTLIRSGVYRPRPARPGARRAGCRQLSVIGLRGGVDAEDRHPLVVRRTMLGAARPSGFDGSACSDARGESKRVTRTGCKVGVAIRGSFAGFWRPARGVAPRHRLRRRVRRRGRPVRHPRAPLDVRRQALGQRRNSPCRKRGAARDARSYPAVGLSARAPPEAYHAARPPRVDNLHAAAVGDLRGKLLDRDRWHVRRRRRVFVRRCKRRRVRGSRDRIPPGHSRGNLPSRKSLREGSSPGDYDGRRS
jgi:hypothetical protein